MPRMERKLQIERSSVQALCSHVELETNLELTRFESHRDE